MPAADAPSRPRRGVAPALRPAAFAPSSDPVTTTIRPPAPSGRRRTSSRLARGSPRARRSHQGRGAVMKVVIFGLGYVGTVTAAGLASRGHDVVGVDVDAGRWPRSTRRPARSSSRASTGSCTRPWPPVGCGRRPTPARAGRAEVSLVCVGTPSSARGDTDLSFIARALSDLRDGMDASPPAVGRPLGRHPLDRPTGHRRRRRRAGLRAGPAARGWTVGTAMCPEFLREGCGVEDFFAPPFVVVGAADPAHPAGLRGALRLPRPADPPRRRRDRRVAEVRVQRLPRRQGHLRERDGPDLLAVRRRLPARHGALLRGPQAQHLLVVPAARFRLRRIVPAEGPAGAAEHGARGRRRPPPR